MSVHIPGGESVCIHSVVVTSSLRRSGVARAMLRHYLQHLSSLEPPNRPSRVLLITKEALVPLYSSVGFDLVGQSSVVHGVDPWHEMVCIPPNK
mmetsp:Transcript_7536/g.12926  ORF Transcript_7536/g.12926 Transcript_7536/m.12926 type:complete len:94 (+) Transcript_7536:344-625(+)